MHLIKLNSKAEYIQSKIGKKGIKLLTTEQIIADKARIKMGCKKAKNKKNKKFNNKDFDTKFNFSNYSQFKSPKILNNSDMQVSLIQVKNSYSKITNEINLLIQKNKINSNDKIMTIERVPSTIKTLELGLMYEKYIAEQLMPLGFATLMTSITQDFGIDVIATKGNIKLAIQCKYWADQVTISAVQEAYAGKDFYDATHAIVVTNSSYTKNAEVLANKIGVYLVNQKLHNNILNLSNFIESIYK